MKHNIFIFLLSLTAWAAHAQVVAIQNHRDNVLYLCIQNPFTVAVENSKSENIVITTDNGKIVNGYKGYFTISPDHLGTILIYISLKTKNGLKVIDSQYFNVKEIPLSKPRLYGKFDGAMPKSILCDLIGPSAQVMCCGFDAKFLIVGFTVVAERQNGKEIFRRSVTDNEGARFDSVTIDFFETTENGDKIKIIDIQMAFCSNVPPRIGEPLEFTITEAEKYKKWQREDPEVLVDPVTGREYIRRKR